MKSFQSVISDTAAFSGRFRAQRMVSFPQNIISIVVGQSDHPDVFGGAFAVFSFT
jgi:hypothetical protein